MWTCIILRSQNTLTTWLRSQDTLTTWLRSQKTLTTWLRNANHVVAVSRIRQPFGCGIQVKLDNGHSGKFLLWNQPHRKLTSCVVQSVENTLKNSAATRLTRKHVVMPEITRKVTPKSGFLTKVWLLFWWFTGFRNISCVAGKIQEKS